MPCGAVSIPKEFFSTFQLLFFAAFAGGKNESWEAFHFSYSACLLRRRARRALNAAN
jgi:hypothetical protein